MMLTRTVGRSMTAVVLISEKMRACPSPFGRRCPAKRKPDRAKPQEKGRMRANMPGTSPGAFLGRHRGHRPLPHHRAYPYTAVREKFLTLLEAARAEIRRQQCDYDHLRFPVFVLLRRAVIVKTAARTSHALRSRIFLTCLFRRLHAHFSRIILGYFCTPDWNILRHRALLNAYRWEPRAGVS